MRAVSLVALTREVSPAIAQCELVHLERRPIDVELARAQHRAYEAALREAGCDVRTLPADSGLPDSVFVEDTAVVLDEVAVITRPGAASRRPETSAVAAALAPHRPLVTIRAPGTVDGGDVLRIGRTIYVGETARTNRAGIDQLAVALAPYGYQVCAVAVRGCLHLKSAATLVAPDTVLCNPRWVDPAVFTGVRVVEVADGEPGAANGLLVGERLIYPENFSATAARLVAQGIALSLVNVSELQKAEGAVTCCSVVLATPSTIRRATADDAPALSAIARAAKAHWGYPAEWLARWDAMLTIGPAELARYEIFVIEEAGRPLGFSATLAGVPRWTLDHLWVLPEAMGRGLGRRLVADALTRATAAGAAGLEIESDPNAEGFYVRCGARRVGWNVAAIPEAPDRRLPRLELDRRPA